MRALTIAIAAIVAITRLVHAAELPITPRKLVVVDKLASAGKAKLVFVAKAPYVTKGIGTDPADIIVEFNVEYANGSAAGAFTLPAGVTNGLAGWIVNKPAVAKYVNKEAPLGPTQAKIAVIKPGKVIKIVGRGQGDVPFDIVAGGDPAGDVSTSYCVTNGGEINCHCSTFTGCVWKSIGGGLGAKLTCKTGVGDETCAAATTTTTTTSTSTSSSTTTSTSTSSSTTTSSSSTSTTSTSTTTSTTTSTLAGPAFPPDGGTVSYGTSGAPSPGDSGGTNFSFTSFSPDTWGRLYWGPSSAALPSAGLDGALHTLSFTGTSGTTATWEGTSSWTNPGPGAAGPHVVPIRMVINISGLGPAPWVLSTSVPMLDPGPGTGIGAVVPNFPTAVDFGGNVQFLADIPTDAMGYIPLNSVRQGTGGNTRSSFTGAFYSAP